MGVTSGHLTAVLADPLVAGRAVEAATAILRRHRQEMLDDLGIAGRERAIVAHEKGLFSRGQNPLCA
jgi:hypothetical protein